MYLCKYSHNKKIIYPKKLYIQKNYKKIYIYKKLINNIYYLLLYNNYLYSNYYFIKDKNLIQSNTI